MQRKNFEKNFLRLPKIENTKKFVKKTMKAMLNFSKFLQNRVFQEFLRGYTCFSSKKNQICKKFCRDSGFEPETCRFQPCILPIRTQEVAGSNSGSRQNFLHI